MAYPNNTATPYVVEVVGPRIQEVFDGFVLVGFARDSEGRLTRQISL